MGRVIDTSDLYSSEFVGASNLDPSSISLFPKNNAAAGAPASKDADRVISMSTIDTEEHSSRTYVLRADTPQMREKWYVSMYVRCTCAAHLWVEGAESLKSAKNTHVSQRGMVRSHELFAEGGGASR